MDVCLLLDRHSLRRWQAAALEHMLEQTDTTVTTLVYNEYNDNLGWLELLNRGLELREWALVGGLYEHLTEPMPELEPVGVETVVNPDAVTEFSVEPRIVDGWKREIPTAEAEAIAGDADVGVRFGFGFLVGPALTAFEYGILSFHHGDLREYRGQPAGFWEYISGEDCAGVTVQRLSETLDGGSIAAFRSVDVSDLRTWYSVRRRLLDSSRPLLAESIRSLEHGRVREPSQLGPIYKLPKGRPVLQFLRKEIGGRIRSRLVSATDTGEEPHAS